MNAHPPIAVIGLACRTPGAANVEEFWRLLLDGRHAVTRSDRAALLAQGVPAALAEAQDFVPAYGRLEDALCFDAAFFGIPAAEAALMDPQIRIGLECAHAAFDAAGHAPGPALGRVGVYVGASLGTYLLEEAGRRQDLAARHGGLRLLMSSDKDHLAGQIAYRLDLRGPAMAVGAACASSLVAVELACRALASGDVDAALAGGVSVHFPQQAGYVHEPGGIYSHDGQCRAFGSDANGVTPGAGAAMLLLKPLSRALEDGDAIHAVLRGWAVAGDGAGKAGYTAPSEDGQVQAIELAWQRAGLTGADAGLIEGHGTGTPLGDAVEIAALHRALPGADCLIGSVKSNVGHLDAAAGALSLIKAVKAVATGAIPPSLHVTTPNAALTGARARFQVPDRLQTWPEGRARVAGVSSFGIGGVNAHVVLSEPPRAGSGASCDGPVVLTLAARDEAALRRLATRMHEALATLTDADLPDLAWTLAQRSAGLAVRAARRVENLAAARDWLAALAQGQEQRHSALATDAAADPAVRAWLSGDDVPDLARQLFPQPRRRLALPAYPFERREHRLSAPAASAQTSDQHHDAPGQAPAQDDAAFEAALSRALQDRWSHGVPATLHQRPGLTAALDQLVARLVHDALAAFNAFAPQGGLCARATLLERVDPRMHGLLDFLLRVAAQEQLDCRTAPPPVSALCAAVAAVAPGFAGYADFLVHCASRVPAALADATQGSEAVYGEDGMQRFAALLAATPPHSEVGAAAQSVALALAQAGRTMRAAGPLRVLEVGAGAGGLTAALVEHLPRVGVELMVTDVSGLFLSGLEARWRDQPGVAFQKLDLTRDPVAQGFAEGSVDVVVALDALHAVRDIDAGMAAIRRLLRPGGRLVALESMRPSRWTSLVWGLSPAWWAARADWCGPLRTLDGWRRFAEARGAGMRLTQARPVGADAGSELGLLVMARAQDDADLGSPSEWLYTPAWMAVPLPRHEAPAQRTPTVLLLPEGPLGEALGAAWPGPSLRCVASDRFERVDELTLRVRPTSAQDLTQALQAFAPNAGAPWRVLHAFALGAQAGPGPTGHRVNGFESMLALTQALAAAQQKGPVRLGVLIDGTADVTGDETLDPGAALVDAPVQLIGRELPKVTAFRLDLDLGEAGVLARAADTAAQLLDAPAAHPLLSLRGRRLWREGHERRGGLRAAAPEDMLTPGASVLVVGGTGGMGRALAPLLARVPAAHVAMTARHPPMTGEIDEARLAALRAQGRLDEGLAAALLEVLDAGATLSLHAADVADEAAMVAVLSVVEASHGPVRAVLHAAGETDQGGVMIRRDPAATERALHAKVHGLDVLLRVLGDRPLDLLVLCASIGSLLPRLKFGEVAYVAANTHLTAAARQLAAQRRATRVLALSWTDWRAGGMWVDAQERLSRQYRIAPGAHEVMPDLLRAITPEQGRQAFLCALGLEAPHVVVCAQALHELLARHASFTPEDHAGFLESHQVTRRAAAADPATPSASPAATTLEGRLATLWAELLGVSSVGPDEDFFELGGDSLLGIRVLNRLRDEFGVEDSLAGLMGATTVNRLADRVRHLKAVASGRPTERDVGFEDIRL
jgi:3-oxoacyl-(acyl-carrier-protein) synthase/SAM-dependent methyltransferase